MLRRKLTEIFTDACVHSPRIYVFIVTQRAK